MTVVAVDDDALVEAIDVDVRGGGDLGRCRCDVRLLERGLEA
jgi:hypothetical protein